MAVINQPMTQVKLTNVSIVRMKKGKKRFEVACYQNKVQDWRKGLETDMDEVIQIPQVFVNVSKGQLAAHEDLKAAFGSTDTDKIILEILKKGDLQLGGKERQQQSDLLHNEVIQMIADKCINPNNKRPYTTSIIDKALTDLGFNMGTGSKPAKTVALEAIKLLIQKQSIPIARASMKIRVVVTDSKEAKKFADKVKALVEVEEEDWSSEWELIGSVDPGSYRQIDEMVKKESKGKGSVEILETIVN